MLAINCENAKLVHNLQVGNTVITCQPGLGGNPAHRIEGLGPTRPGRQAADPMDMMFMEQHFLRSPLRLYSDMEENNNSGSLFSAAMVEKARAQLQLWGRGPGYPPGEIMLPYGVQGARVHVTPSLYQYPGLLLPPPVPPPQQTPPPPNVSAASTPSSSSGSPSPSDKLPRPAAVFPQHRFSPYQLVPKGRETVPTRN
ncbi:embryonic heart tube elongation [Homalodisca vitripennis]|nr:embryonic heart tube elongation [Homalodisca vitripennis]